MLKYCFFPLELLHKYVVISCDLCVNNDNWAIPPTLYGCLKFRKLMSQINNNMLLVFAGKQRSTTRTVLIIIVSTVAITMIIVISICIILKVRRPKEKVESKFNYSL